MLVNGIDSHEAYGGDPWKIYAIIIMTGLIVSISLNGLWVLLCGLIGLGNTIVYIGVYIISSVCVLVGFGLKLSGDELHDPIEYTLDDNQEKLVLDRLFTDISPMGSTVWGLFLGFFIGSLFSLIYFQNGPIGLTGSQDILESIFATVNISILAFTFGLIDLSTVTGINYQYSILSHWVFVLFRLLIQMAFILMILGVIKQSNFRKLEFNIDDVTTENVEDWVKLFLSKDIEKIYQKYTEEYVFLTICDEYLCGDEQSVQALMLKFPQIIPKIPEEVRECFVDSSTGKELIPDSLMGQGGLQYMTPRGQRAVKQELVDKWTDDAITSHIEEHLAQRMEAK